MEVVLLRNEDIEIKIMIRSEIKEKEISWKRKGLELFYSDY
jgi:hypothetical protein